MSETTLLWVGAGAMAVGALAILLLGGASTRRQAGRTGLHGLVCVITAAAYVGLATGAQTIDVAIDVPVRVVDLSLTAALLLLALAVTAAPRGTRIDGLAIASAAAAVAMVVTGAVALDAHGGTALLFLALSLAALAAVLGLLWGPMARSAAAGHPVRQELYRRHAGLLTVLWCLYPPLMIVGPGALDLLDATWTLAGLIALDVASRAAYGLLVVLEDDRLIAVEKHERVGPGRPPTPPGASGGPQGAASPRGGPDADGTPRRDATPDPARLSRARPPRRPLPRHPALRSLHRLRSMERDDLLPVAVIAASLLVIAWPRRSR
ncbi:bacteriorhodopsin [Acuticoccus mangrovi]|uniref:Bacteriorhodopsin n=1 Tax=Acuticoccus mangrovi TaxID=2796142 RepID=A0A934IPV9_9HYPH|nr:bacteriorhodopsin [Acuticoccus mangrovi]MBJ3775419.1 bacteriorhodopsin [Acuticoccus mangrovi]